MLAHSTRALAFWFWIAAIALSPLAAQENAGLDEDAARQQQVVDRFLVVLEKNPRRGTALDRVYGFHVESGTLDKLLARYQDRVAKDAKDAASWTILGLVESQRGKDAAAVEAFTKAAAASKDALPAYYLGQSLVLVGQPDKAAAAFEDAISRKPARADVLEIFQALGRVHQRAQRTKEALEVWSRLEKLFPGDARVQEQIAATLAEEGQTALALPRYETLLKLTKDDYRKAVYKIEAAQLKIKLNRSAEAIVDLEALLATLNPTSWLHRDVRKKIEDVYLKSDDQDGLARYYEGWVARNPEDVDAMARLARILARQARVPEAQVWLDKALKLAPSRKELRAAFIEQLVDDQRYTEAIAQYEQLDKADPNNPDYLRDWGKLILRDTSRTKEARLAAAEKIWRRLLAARPKDPLIATQVADLFRHSEMSEPAFDLYKKAVELAPDQPQYREYLGEYYHQLKRSDEALATWREIAAGKKRTAETASRLAEVLATFGYLDQAIPEIEDACKLDPKDFSLQLKAADLLAKAEKYPEALTYLTQAQKLSQNAEESEAVLAAQIKIYQLEDSLTKRTLELAQQVKDGKPTASQLFLLARFHETLREFPEATRAIDAAIKLEPQSIPSLAAAARIYEQAGDLGSAADLSRKLAAIDRRGRSDYLKHVAQLETQMGRTAQALAAGRELITSAPGNTENYEFYAELCFRLGQSDEGLATLRRAVRVNPNEPKLVLSLAESLSGQFRTDEAIELYWQAYDKATALDDKLSVVMKLADLYLQTNQLDRLLDRLERIRRDADEKRESTICLSQAYHSAGDYGMARQELESLLNDNTRDTQLLQQLSKLSETEGDLAAAVKYQEHLTRLAPGAEMEFRLATLLARSGAPQESAAILVRLATKEEDPEKLLRNIDGLLSANQHETALVITETKLREEPKNWELLYREGVALAKNKPELAAQRFQAILALPHADADPGVVEKNRRAKAAKSKSTTTTPPRARFEMELSRTNYASAARVAVGLVSREYYGGSVTFWSPADYGQARMAALGWLLRFAQDAKQGVEFAEKYKKEADAPAASPRALWDQVYLSSIQGSMDRVEGMTAQTPIAKKLARSKDLAGQYMFISTLMYRDPRYRGEEGGVDTTPPLSNEDMELLVASHEAIQKWNIAQGGSGEAMLQLSSTLLAELKRAGRTEDEQKLLKQMIDSAKRPDDLALFIYLSSSRSDHSGVLAMFDKWARLTLQDPKPSMGNSFTYASYGMGQSMGISGAAKRHAEVFEILDGYLEYNQARSHLQRQKATRRSTPTAASSSRDFVTWYGRSGRQTYFNYPSPNDYYDRGALQLLRNAFEIVRRNDVVSDLTAHLKERLAKAAPADKMFGHLALAYVYSWNEEKELATAQLEAASALAGSDWAFRLEVARFYLEAQDHEEAMRLIDTLTPPDQDAMRERETMALNLAVRLGDQDRARLAAERLFGLRLTAETQIQLASQMRRLGMNQESEAVLSRAQRQAGSRLAALVTLMNTHQSEGRGEVAAQIAYQILRRSRTPGSTPVLGRGAVSSDENARRSALQTLSASGKLKEMIAAAESQLARSPQSTQLFATLAEYHQAAGDNAKSLALQGKLLEANPDDADLRRRYARALSQSGKTNEAVEVYKTLIRKQPRFIANDFYEVQELFRQAKKENELVALLSEIDLRQLGQPYYAVNLANNMLQNPEQRPAGLAFFKRAWEAFPEYRSELLSNIYRQEIWDLPEFYEYGRQALMPTPTTLANDPWGPVRVNNYNSGGEAQSVLRYVLDGAAKTSQLPSLRADVAKSVEAFPTWRGGPLALAAIDARLGNVPEARQGLEAALAEKNAAQIPGHVRWVIGQEFETKDELKDLAFTLYEGVFNETASRNDYYQFEYSPGPRLLKLYAAAGRKDDARQLLAKAEKLKINEAYDPYDAIQIRSQTLMAIGKHYEQLEFHADALRVYREMIDSVPDDPQLRLNSNFESYQRQGRQQIDAILARLSQAESPDLIRGLLAPTSQESGSAVNLMLGTSTQRDGAPRFESHFVQLIASRKLPPKTLEAASGTLAELAAKRPQDLSVKIAAAIVALRYGDQKSIAAALSALHQLVAATPLEELPAGQRANSRQRAAALLQVPLWLVAAECLGRDTLREEGEFLAARALEAARRQADTKYASAILYDRIAAAQKSGDKAAMKAHLVALLEVARPAASKSGGKGKAVPPNTLSQFQLALGVASRAAEDGFPELAVEAARQSLLGGLPVPDPSNTALVDARRGRMPTAAISGEIGPSPEDVQITQAVASQMTRLSATWRTKGHSPDAMYSVLHGVVFPVSRPGEILLYEQSLDNLQDPRSLGRELVRWAVAAKKVDELRGDITKRVSVPTVQANVMLVFLALETKRHQDAVEPLGALAKQVQAQPAVALVLMASHAASLAMGEKELKAQAAPLLESAAQSLAKANNAAGDAAIAQLASHYVATGRIEQLRTMYDTWLQTKQARYARYGGDQGIYQQQQDLTKVASAVATSGDFALTLEYVGRMADLPTTRYYGRDASLSPLMYHLARQARGKPAMERYGLLREWTMPTETRRAIRFIATFASADQTPAAFVPPAPPGLGPPPGVEVISNLTLLVEAAREAGALDDLAAESDKWAAEKLAHAEALSTLAAIARGDRASIVKVDALAAEMHRRYKEEPGAPVGPTIPANDRGWEDLLIVQAANNNPAARVSAARLAETNYQVVKKARTYEHLGQAARLATLPAIAALPPKEQERLLSPNLALWTPATPPQFTAGNKPPVWWSASSGQVALVGGSDYNSLYFNYPLTGEFAFDFEAHFQNFGQGHVGYGGLICLTEWWANAVRISPVSRYEEVLRGGAIDQNFNWNRYSVRTTPKSFKFFANGHLVFEESDPSPTSPWLHLLCNDDRRLAFRKLAISGRPEIPRQVELTHGDRLEGWTAAFFGGKLPTRLPLRDLPSTGPTRISSEDARPNDWHSENGVLHGRFDGAAPKNTQSLLAFHRPLLSGETLRYEFLYEPGKTIVHPALGRLAFLLAPQGVRLHWLTRIASASDPHQIAADNAVDEPASRRGPAELPLKEGAWNQMEVSLAQDVITLKLNGEPIYERTLEPANTRQFGLFHYRDESAVQVRGAVLAGNWPQRLGEQEQSQLLTLASAESPAMRLARSGLVREEELVEDAFDVWRSTRSLAARERLAALTDWVLPSPSHATFRLQAAFTPTDASSPLAPREEALGKRKHAGGELVSPAMALVETAAELKQLDALEAAIRAAAVAAPASERDVLALQTMIAAARGNDTAGAAALKQLRARLESIPPDAAVYQRYPEVVAVHAAVARPALREDALAIADYLVVSQQGNYHTLAWERLVRWLRAEARWRSDAKTASLPMGEPPPGLTQWTPVSHPTAEARGIGLPPATWRYEKGKAAFFTGNGDDSLYFRSPLAGNFEVTCRRTTFGWKEIRLMYAAIAIDPHHEGSAIFRIPQGRAPVQFPLREKLPNWAELVDYRLAVKDGQYTAFINGQEVHTEKLGPHVDPWLAIQTHTPHVDGSIENLRILGKPTVPDVLEISAAPTLTSWRADYYGEAIETPTSPWGRQGDEIVGRLFERAPGSNRESVLYYHRPLLEDGEIQYEFYYEAGKTEVHPALDTLALMLTPEGVKLHRLTQGACDRTGLDPYNLSPLPGSAKTLPLVEKSWNKLKLVVTGDVVSLSLNGQKIGVQKLEPTNQRLFGLFRFSDATACRVKNVTYRGNWPKEIPALAQQELAAP